MKKYFNSAASFSALAFIIILFASCKKASVQAPVTDRNSTALITDFNNPDIYTSIKIGTQKWMTKNLAVTHYRNGDKIPQVKDATKWANLTTGAWCWYNNDSATYAVFGKLYNWYAVNDPRGLAPTGWHVSSDAEWGILSTYLGKNAGGKLKDTGTINAGTGFWYTPNRAATNKTGFTALGGGRRDSGGSFYFIWIYGYWWSSTEDSTNGAWLRIMGYDDGGVSRVNLDKTWGFSVRCLRD